jgi:hypothetical protein
MTSRRVIESAGQRHYATDFEAAERYASGGAVASAAPELPERAREAHFESARSRTPQAISSTALHLLGRHLGTHENFARELAKAPRAALARLGFLSERDKHRLGEISGATWEQLTAAAEKYKHVAIGAKAAAGVPTTPMGPADYLGGIRFGGRGAPDGLGEHDNAG